ncbi:MAG: ribosome assembly cofactor RimP [Flavobacteriaceae bacterium]|nr:ribosome assembly cofactor RimP [Flavobacteriaceae bacterium]
MFKELVNKLLQAGLDEKPELFLIDFTVDTGNKISVVLDGDNGVSVKDCIFISRAIDNNLDDEEHEFSLDVASCGATSPLKTPRQYIKNIARTLAVKLQSGNTLEGKMTKANDESITLEWDTREPKPIGKGKITVHKIEEIAYSDIVEAKVVIKF